MDNTPLGATIPGQNGPGSNVNEGVLCIPQSSSITGISSSNCLVSYPGHSLGWRESYSFEKMLSVYSTTTTANWASDDRDEMINQWEDAEN